MKLQTLIASTGVVVMYNHKQKFVLQCTEKCFVLVHFEIFKLTNGTYFMGSQCTYFKRQNKVLVNIFKRFQLKSVNVELHWK